MKRPIDIYLNGVFTKRYCTVLYGGPSPLKVDILITEGYSMTSREIMFYGGASLWLAIAFKSRYLNILVIFHDILRYHFNLRGFQRDIKISRYRDNSGKIYSPISLTENYSAVIVDCRFFLFRFGSSERKHVHFAFRVNYLHSEVEWLNRVCN